MAWLQPSGMHGLLRPGVPVPPPVFAPLLLFRVGEREVHAYLLHACTHGTIPVSSFLLLTCLERSAAPGADARSRKKEDIDPQH